MLESLAVTWKGGYFQRYLKYYNHSVMFTNLLSKPVLRLSMVILVNDNLGLLRVAPALGKEIKQRNFARWSVRTPSKVFTSEELSSGSIDSKHFDQSEYKDSSKDSESSNEKTSSSKYNQPKNKKQNYKTTSYEGKKYEYLENGDLAFTKMMTAATNRKLRKRNDLIVLEGKRLNLDAMQVGLKPKKLFFSMPKLLKDMNLPVTSNFPLYKLSYKTTKTWSQLDTPPGVVGFYTIPKLHEVHTKDTIPVKVICDNVRDPGNMGSIIRVAASAGCTQIFLMKGCTDPWDPKVLRAASGGHFRIPISMEVSWDKQRGFLQPTDVLYLADSKVVRPDLPPALDMDTRVYFEASYVVPGNVVVVVGGETEGLSEEAFRAAAQHNGSRVYIPLSNRMESLNSGSALSVVLFEVKKQILQSGYQFPVLITDSPTQEEPTPSRSPEFLKSAGG